MPGRDFKFEVKNYKLQRDVLYWLRKKRKMSREFVRKQIGVSINTLVRYENDMDANGASMRVVMLLCRLYGVKVSKFYQMVEVAESSGCDVEKLVGDMLHE